MRWHLLRGLGAIAWLAAATAPGVTEPTVFTAVPVDSARAWDAQEAFERDVSVLPVHASGDLHVVADAAVFRDADDERVVDVAVAVPHVDLEWVRAGQRYRAELIVEVTVRDDRRKTERTFTAEPRLFASSFQATRRADAKGLWVMRGRVNFTPSEIHVRVEDARSQKKTLVGLLKKSHRSGEARGLLPRDRAVSPEADLSGILFGASVVDLDGPDVELSTLSVHAGVGVRPAPSRFYGAERSVFPIYYEIYRRSPDSGFRSDSLANRVRYRILDTRGTEVMRAEETQRSHGGRAGRIQRFDVSEYPTGTYTLAIELLDDDGRELDVTYGDFHVLWNAHAWAEDEETVLNDARVLLSPGDFEVFEAKAPGERAAYMAALWESLDPSPGTPENEARAEFEARLRQAERDFRGLDGGKLSDRGRLLIRFGEPDEIVKVRIPSRDDSFSDVFRDEIEGGLSGLVDLNDPRLEQLYRKYINANPAFEIWKYYSANGVLMPGLDPPGTGMAFILVDENGVGIYRLAYSSVVGIL